MTPKIARSPASDETTDRVDGRRARGDRTRTAILAKAVDIEEPLPQGVTAGTGSLFMDLYAAKARRWMQKTGTDVSDFARVVVKSRHAASFNPVAQFRKETTIEEVLEAAEKMKATA